jgi:hypothetical protein
VVKGSQGMRMYFAGLAAYLSAVPVMGRAADTLAVFRAGDTAKASAVNANFRLLLDHVNALAAANQRLGGKIDSLQKARPPASGGETLEGEIAGMRKQIQDLQARLDSAAKHSHLHPVSQVTGLQDSLHARVAAKGGPLKVCTGATDAGSGWVDYNAYAVYIDVDTKACGFASTPQYFTSLGGATLHYATTGATSIYLPTATGFRIYLANEPWSAAQQRPPSSWGLFINWIAIGP